MPAILGYWNLRGRGEPIRLILQYVNEKYEEKTYLLGNMDEWFQQEKPKLGRSMDFPNLPYYIDGDVKISELRTILEYIGRKHGLDGINEKERIRMSLGIEFTAEMFQAIIQVAYPASYPPIQMANREEVHESLRQAYEDQLPTKLTLFEKFLKGNKWVAGDRVTYADFFVYDILDINRWVYDAKYIQHNVGVSEYMKRFEELKGIKEYLASPTFPPMPIFSPLAMFGQTKDFKAKPAKN